MLKKTVIGSMLLSVGMCVYADNISNSDKKIIEQSKLFQNNLEDMAQKSDAYKELKDTNSAIKNKTLKDPNIEQERIEQYQNDMNNKFKDSKSKQIEQTKETLSHVGTQVEKAKEFAPIISPTGAGSALTLEQMQAIEKDSKAFVEYALQTIENAPQDIKDLAEAIKSRGEKLSTEAISRERERLAKLNGVDLKATGGLYYFVSFDMPLEMLRSYAVESMYTGGALVFRGMREGRTKLNDFVMKDLYNLMYGSNNQNQVSIKIEPQLYDAFKVKVVPTIVYTENIDPLYCFIPNEWTYEKQENVEIEVNGKKVIETQVKKIPLKTESCLELDASKYWKISGAITSHYALEQFVEKGAVKAQAYLDKLKDAYNGKPTQELKPFTGEWKEVITEADQKTVAELESQVIVKQNDVNKILNNMLAPK